MHAELSANLSELQSMFGWPGNDDYKQRSFAIGPARACAVFIEGMADEERIGAQLLRQTAELGRETNGELDRIVDRCVAVAGMRREADIFKARDAVLDGQCLLLVDGSTDGLILDVRGYERRSVSEPANENVVMGSQEGFTENLRTNITLIRRMVRSHLLTTEQLSCGKSVRCCVSVLYMRGIADMRVLEQVRNRLEAIDIDIVPGAGFVNQLLEGNTLTLVPQTCLTERPDRCASFLLEGQVLVAVDGAPYVIAVPITFFHLMNAPDDTFMRWQYGTLTRLIRYMGLLCAMLLPSVYLSLSIHHQELIPVELLASISAARAQVPFSVLFEVLIMEFAFLLVDQSGTRMPRIIGGALGIFGALILGQAASDANIVSPIMIIVVALTALGGYSIPSYPLERTVQIIQFVYILAAVMGGFFGLSAALLATIVPICALEPFGMPYFASVAPHRGHNPDLVYRGRLRKQRRRDSVSAADKNGGGK